MPPKRSAIGRTGTPARAFAPSVSPTRRRSRNTPARVPANPQVENPQLPDVQTEQSFSYGSTKTPLLPRQLKARPRMTTAQMVETIDEAKAQGDANIQVYRDEVQRQVDQSASDRDLRAARRSMSRDSNQSVEPSVNGDSQIGRSTATTPTTRRATSLAQSHDLSQIDEDEDDIDPDSFDQDSIQLEPEIDAHAEANQQFSREASLQIPQRSPLRKFADWVGDISFNRERSFFHGVDDASVVAEDVEQKRFVPALLDTLWTPVEFLTSRAHFLLSKLSPSPNSKIRQMIRTIPVLLLAFFVTSVPLIIYTDDLPYFGYRIGRTASNLKAFLHGISHGFNAPLENLDHSTLHSSDPPNSAALAIMDSRLSAYSSSLSSLSQTVSMHSSDLKSVHNSLDTLSSSVSRHSSKTQTISPSIPPWSRKINFASLSHGAIIDPYLTSPTYERPFPLLTRLFAPNAVKEYRSQPPAEALRGWREYGECWCASASPSASISGGKAGGGVVQLAVLLGKKIVPTEIVVEFLAKELNPSGGWRRTPKRIEVWADYGDLDAKEFNAAAHDSIAIDTADAKRSRSRIRPLPDSFLPIGIMNLDEQDLSLTSYSSSSSVVAATYIVSASEGRLAHAIPLRRLGPVDGLAFVTSKLVFVVTDNFGADVTCLYRVRVHGDELLDPDENAEGAG